MTAWITPSAIFLVFDVSGNTGGAKPLAGLRLFFRNLSNNFVPIVTINILFLACSLPIFTVGAAIAALNRICCQYADNQQVIYPVKEFFQAFRDNFRQGTAAGLLWLFFVATEAFALYILLIRGGAHMLVYFVLALSAFVVSMVFAYVFPQIAMISLPLKTILRNSLLLMLYDLKRSVLAALLSTIITIGPLFLLPWSIVFYVALLFSLSSLVSASITWQLIKEKIAAGQL